MFRFIFACAVAALLATGTPARATPITFFGEDKHNGPPHPNSDAARASFLSNLVGVGTQGFDSLSAGTNLPINNLPVGSSTASLTGSGTINNSSSSSGQYAISPPNFLATTSSFTLTFNTPQAAFGFYGTDVGDQGGQLSISLDGGSTFITVPHTVGSNGSTNGYTLFFGVIDTGNPFSSVIFKDTDSGDVFGFDDFTIGTQQQVSLVPEPASLAVFGLVALVGAAYSIRRRKASAKAPAC
jgi:hypothetical protein